MRRLQRKINVRKDSTVSSEWSVPDNYRCGTALLIAHGAGNDMHSPFLVHVHKALADRGLMTVRFNFPYKETGRRAPDRPALLEVTWQAVIEYARNDTQLAPRTLVLSGKSMGGRIASMVAAQGSTCDGLVFFGYPLHAPGKAASLRVEHFKRVTCPMLFIQGTRDPLCRLDLLKPALKALSSSITLHEIVDGDHSFKVLKRTGRSDQEVWDEIVDVSAQWIGQLDSNR